MPKPWAVCLENLDATDPEGRFVRCAALPGRQPGLRLDPDGGIAWRRESPGAEIWVTADDRVALFRDADAPAVRVSRAGRSLDVPPGRPVPLRGGDQLVVGGRSWRLHLHGETRAPFAPAPLVPAPAAPNRVAAAVALGAAAAGLVAGCGNTPPADPTFRPESEDVWVEPPADAESPDIEMRYYPPAPPLDYELYHPTDEPAPDPATP